MQDQKNAFVWLLMLGDDYLAGVLVSAWSFRRKETQYDLVIMVTPDITEDTKTILRQVFDLIVDVPYIEIKSTKMKTQKQREIYTWVDKSYTKWNLLSLIKYDKVCFIDADLVTLKNIDEIFKHEAPASIFKSSYEKIYDPYNNPNPGSVIYPEQIWKGLTMSSFVASAYIIVLPTSIKYYRDLINMVKSHETYGFTDCYYAHDEQSISHYMSCYDKGPKLNWSVIDPRYGFNIGKYNMLNVGEVPYAIHYVNKPKPWFMKGNWPDLDIWWSLCRDLNNIPWKNIKLEQSLLHKPNSKECIVCKQFLLVDYTHAFLECNYLKIEY